jgi:hypothetical protein
VQANEILEDFELIFAWDTREGERSGISARFQDVVGDSSGFVEYRHVPG